MACHCGLNPSRKQSPRHGRGRVVGSARTSTDCHLIDVPIDLVNVAAELVCETTSGGRMIGFERSEVIGEDQQDISYLQVRPSS